MSTRIDRNNVLFKALALTLLLVTFAPSLPANSMIVPGGTHLGDIVIEPNGANLGDIVIEPNGANLGDIVIEPNGLTTR